MCRAGHVLNLPYVVLFDPPHNDTVTYLVGAFDLWVYRLQVFYYPGAVCYIQMSNLYKFGSKLQLILLFSMTTFCSTKGQLAIPQCDCFGIDRNEIWVTDIKTIQREIQISDEFDSYTVITKFNLDTLGNVIYLSPVHSFLNLTSPLVPLKIKISPNTS